jgi:hypothetical protein
VNKGLVCFAASTEVVVGGDVAAGLGIVVVGFLPKSNFNEAGADGVEVAALLEGAPNIDGGLTVLEVAPNVDGGLGCTDVDVGVEEGGTLGFAKGNGTGLLVSVVDAAGAEKGFVDAEVGAANGGCAGVGPKENEGTVVAAGAGVGAATGLPKKLGIEGADDEVGAVVVVVVGGGCVVSGPNESAGAAGAGCGVDEVGNRLGLLAAGAEAAGVTLAGVGDPPGAADFEASVLVEVLPNENDGVSFVSVPPDVDAVGGGGVNVMMGTAGALEPSSGAVALVGSSKAFDCGVSPFFCSSIRARIFAIASASRSCFSHFENARNPGRDGPSTTPGINSGVCVFEEATRRPVEACGKGCLNGFTRAEPLVNDWRKARLEMGLFLIESQSRSLPVFVGDTGASPGLGSFEALGVSCHTSSCRSSASLYCSSVSQVST